MRAAERTTIPVAAAALSFAALFFSGAADSGPLLWIGGAGLVAAALALAAAPPRLDRAGWGFLGSLAALALWCGLTIVWSISPATSWTFTNRMLAYLGFAALGTALARLVPRRALADGAAALLGLLFGWALLTKVVPSLYPDYGRVARLRGPIGYWNELALLGVVGGAVALALATAAGRRALLRAAGVLLLYAAALVILLTYSRANIVIAVLVAVAWLALERTRRVESVAALALGVLPAIGVFGVALALPGITNDGTSHATRAHDGWIFALVVVAVGAAVVAASLAVLRRAAGWPLPDSVRAGFDRALRALLVVAAVAAVVLVAVFAGRVWHGFTKAGEVGGGPTRLASVGSGNRWGWWQQAWHAFLHHPGGGTGAGTFALTNTLHKTNPFDVATEPHNVPLQFLSETGVPGLLLFLGVVACAAVAIVRARRRSGEAAVTALALGLAALAVHALVDVDWQFLAVCGPLLLVAGALVAEPRAAAVAEPLVVRRRALAVAGLVVLAAACVYSLALPWLAQRELNRSVDASASGHLDAAYAHARRARDWNPLSLDALEQMAATAPTARDAARLYLQATRLEPLNPDAWLALGTFAYEHGDMREAYLALDRSWGLDRVDPPLSDRCSILDRARRAVLHYGPICP